MATHIVADPDARTLTLTTAPVDGFSSIRVREDIYSDLKLDWLSTAALQKLRFPFDPVGGDDISATEKVGQYVFVRNDRGWRLVPYDADHELYLTGNIFARDPDLPLWLTRPGRTIQVYTERSAQAVLSQSGAIDQMSFQVAALMGLL